MPPLALDCPLCCKETFHSKDTLKHHLLETIDNLRCRLCNAGCSDILELVEHLEKNCGKDLVQVKCENTNSMEDYEDVCEMVDDQGEEIVDDQGAETAESKNTEAEESNDNDPNGLYSCLMCNMNFSSIEKHLEKYHEGEEVLLETDDVDEEQVQEVENTGDESEEYEETFIDEVEEPKRPFSQKRTKELSLNRGSTVKTVVGANVTDDDADIDDGGTYPPRNPIVEKYLFSNEPRRAKPRPCCVPTCKERNKQGSCHRFPKREPDIFNIWLDKIRPVGFEDLTQDEIYNRYVVCEAHFESSCFVFGTIRGLTRTAVPTLNMPQYDSERRIEKSRARTCCVPTCKVRGKPGSRHRFPKSQPEMFNVWLNKIRPVGFDSLTKDEIYSRYVICEAHFESKCFEVGTRSGLIRTAVPTLDMPNYDSAPKHYSRCCVAECKRLGPYHCFPAFKRKPDLFKVWLDNTKPKGWDKEPWAILHGRYRICRAHFKVDDFCLRSGIIRLKPYAVPTKNIPGFDEQNTFEPDPPKSRTCDKYIKLIEDAIAGCDNRGLYNTSGSSNQQPEEYYVEDLNSEMSEEMTAIDEEMCEVRLLDDNEFEAIKDRSLVSEILRCPGCTLKFPNLAHYHKHKCVKKNVSAMLKPKPKKPAVVSENLRQGIKEGKYTCTFCQMRYPSLKALKMHMKIHLVEDESGNIVPNTVTLSLHQCDICNTKFPTLKSLRLHSKMHKPVPEKEVEPPVDYNIMGETEVNEEGDAMNVKHEMFQCQECFKEFDVKYKEAHLQSHNDESEYDCSICNKKFHSQSNLEMHMKAHSDVKKFSCSYCKKPFNTYEALENHTKTDCLQKSYECQYCGRRFSKPHEKVKHERIHTGEKPHVCQVCGKSFRVSFCLTLHMRTHTGSRPYMCNQCGKRFKSNGVYVHHLKTHSDVRNYKCPYCAKAFKTSVQLSSHKNSHTKPFSCTECNRPFASLYAVRAHMATHKKENNLKYDCWLCGATYARSFALKDHMNSVHMDYSITGETQNGEAVTIHGEPEEVEYEQVEEDEERMQGEENEVTEIVTEEITNVEMVES